MNTIIDQITSEGKKHINKMIRKFKNNGFKTTDISKLINSSLLKTLLLMSDTDSIDKDTIYYGFQDEENALCNVWFWYRNNYLTFDISKKKSYISIRNTLLDGADEEDFLECPICMETQRNEMINCDTCGKAMCPKCRERMTNEEKVFTCPFCRQVHSLKLYENGKLILAIL